MKKDNLIFLHKFLKAVADSIIKVFIPLFILKETNDILLAMGYLVIYSLSVMITMFVLKKVIQKYGVFSIMVHFIPIIGTMALFSFAPVNIYSVVGAAIMMSLSQTLYSIPLNLIFAFGDKRTNVGKFQIGTNIGKLVFTLISGYILSSNIKNSFLILSISASIIYIVSIFPLMFSYKDLISNYKRVENASEKKEKIDKLFILFHIAFGIFQPIMDNVIPLFLYINNLSFQSVTLMIVLVEACKILINYFSQFMVKRNKDIILVILSSILFMVSAILMLVLKNSLALYIVSCTCSVSFPLTFVPMFRIYCDEMKKENNVFYGITRRDFDIFSFRPGMYLLSFIGLGLYPCIITGIVSVPVMLYSEIKLIRKYKIGGENNERTEN